MPRVILRGKPMEHKSYSKNITPDMTVLEIVSRYRRTEAVFRRYDFAAGECICCNALFERLEDVAARYRLDLDQLLRDLEGCVNHFTD